MIFKVVVIVSASHAARLNFEGAACFRGTGVLAGADGSGKVRFADGFGMGFVTGGGVGGVDVDADGPDEDDAL